MKNVTSTKYDKHCYHNKVYSISYTKSAHNVVMTTPITIVLASLGNERRHICRPVEFVVKWKKVTNQHPFPPFS